MHLILKRLSIIIGLLSLTWTSEAMACPDGQYESCVFGVCVCVPEIGGDVGRGAEHLKGEIQGQAIGLPLEQWFNASRDSSINGAMPIPPNIRRILTGFSDEDAMNRVRYRMGDNGALNLAHIIQQWRFYDVTAVTLVDVIVFRGPTEANDPCLWAHELIHIQQFRDWGVHSFAVSYARNPNSAEDAAYAKERECRARLSSQPLPFPPPQPFPQQQLGAFCYTQFGRFGPGPIQPLGAPCSIMTPQGPVWGQVGH